MNAVVTVGLGLLRTGPEPMGTAALFPLCESAAAALDVSRALHALREAGLIGPGGEVVSPWPRRRYGALTQPLRAADGGYTNRHAAANLVAWWRDGAGELLDLLGARLDARRACRAMCIESREGA
jgi:hypothetical protein